MKSILVLLLVGVLLTTAACTSTAAASDSTQSQSQSESVAELSENTLSPTTQAPKAPGGKREEFGIMGKIVSVTDTEITLTLAQRSTPENSQDRPTPPERNAADSNTSRPERPPEGSKPEGSSPDGSRPEGKGPDGSRPEGGRGPGGFGQRVPTEFTGETKAYTLSDTVEIRSGMGDSAQTVDRTALTVDSIVIIELDENQKVTSISLIS